MTSLFENFLGAPPLVKPNFHGSPGADPVFDLKGRKFSEPGSSGRSLLRHISAGRFVYQPVFSVPDEDDENSLSEMPFTTYAIQSFDESSLEEEKQPERKSKSTVTNFTMTDPEDYLQFAEVSEVTIPSSQELGFLPQETKRSSCTTHPRRTTEKTPTTHLKMMERHRESERVRHHTLNELMRNVCECVPGYSDVSKETKVVMMQRIISYICYLENTITSLCQNIGVKVNSLRMSTKFLNNQWKMDSGKVSSLNENMKVQDNFIQSTTKFRRHEPEIIAIKCKPSEKPVRRRVEQLEQKRLKISSPTVDSTTDGSIGSGHLMQRDEDSVSSSHVCTTRSEGSQDSSIPTSCTTSIGDTSQPTQYGLMIQDAELNDNICPEENLDVVYIPEQFVDTPTKYFSSDAISTSDNFDTFPDPFDLMSSPVGKRHFGMLSPKMDGFFSSPYGIRSDKRDLNETLELGENEMKTVSPECILQTNLGSQDDVEASKCSKTACDSVSETSNSNTHSSPGKSNPTPGRIISTTPVKSPVILGKNKRKQYTPMRSPFHDVTNYLKSPENNELYGPISFDVPKPKKMRLDNDLMPGKFARESPLDEDFVSYVPYIWKFHSAKFTKRQKAEPPTCLPFSPGKENAEGQDSLLSKPEKVDHRKTTWMNGFMMFSRLNRRSFISANPGVHTSQISKMMGHTWRNMSAEEQLPYKEKAQMCASRMKLSSPSLFDPNEDSNDSISALSSHSNQDDDANSDGRRVSKLLEKETESD